MSFVAIVKKYWKIRMNNIRGQCYENGFKKLKGRCQDVKKGGLLDINLRAFCVQCGVIV